MNHAVFTMAVVICLAYQASTSAQDSSTARTAQVENEISFADVKVTPEMWFYIQERRRHDNPQDAVRRKAEYRAKQRQERIAATKAAGRSKQRPSVENTIFSSMFTTRYDYNWKSIWPTRIVDVYYRGVTFDGLPGDAPQTP